MFPWRILPVVRPDLNWLSWALSWTVSRFHSMILAWLVSWLSRSIIRTYAWSVSRVVALRSVWRWPCHLHRLVLIARLEVVLLARWLVR